jgi:hypothetical protein
MRSIYTYLLIIFAAFWVLALSLSFITGLQKVFRLQSDTPSTLNSVQIRSKEKRFIEETKDKQKQLMENYKQKLQDYRYRNF